MTDGAIRVGSVSVEVTIEATPETVWQALTNDIGEWWPQDFYAGGTAGERRFALEAEAGGRMYESWGDGGGVLWGTVVCVEPERTLQVLGNQFPNWGGPTQWYGTWTLSKSGKGTRLDFAEAVVGTVSDEALREKRQGWQHLWATLKSYLEHTPAPAWGAQS